MVGGIALVVVAALLVAAAVALFLWGLYQYSAGMLNPILGTLVTGVASLIAAGVLVWIASRMTR
ncbi:hypothetical protein [Thiohalorhabdus methylotrophus]|uniref:Uncharacterized protein n=1 Tax=Thiohalorhabdus methylotrophus TaxID=3242694 RepID=A0ABV4TUE3_9GAMM